MSLRRIVACIAAVLAVLALVGCGGVPVPDLTGSRLIMSPSTLEREGFALGTVAYDEDASEPVGTVIDQRPRPGRNARPGALIEVTVAGPALTRMPRLVGAHWDEARVLLNNAGLSRGRVRERFDSRFAAGTVIEQSELAGAQLSQRKRIDVVLSLGPEVVQVPGVVGRETEAAQSFLRDLGFSVSRLFEHSARPVGEVIAQRPDVRFEAEPGAEVRITVSRGPVTCVMPDLDGMSLAQARSELDDLGLKYAAASTDGAIMLSADSVIVSQEPIPGKVIPEGVTVILRTK